MEFKPKRNGRETEMEEKLGCQECLKKGAGEEAESQEGDRVEAEAHIVHALGGDGAFCCRRRGAQGSRSPAGQQQRQRRYVNLTLDQVAGPHSDRPSNQPTDQSLERARGQSGMVWSGRQSSVHAASACLFRVRRRADVIGPGPPRPGPTPS